MHGERYPGLIGWFMILSITLTDFLVQSGLGQLFGFDNAECGEKQGLPCDRTLFRHVFLPCRPRRALLRRAQDISRSRVMSLQDLKGN